jgi:hypothetical protein
MNCLLTVKSILSYEQQPISAIDVEKYATFGTKRQEMVLVVLLILMLL